MFSKYNVYGKPVEGKVAVFNTASQNFAVFDEEILGDGYTPTKDDYRLGFAVHPQLDEFERVLALRRSLAKQSARICDVVIAPTLGCNLACSYCFNGEGFARQLSDNSVESAIEFLQEELHEYDDLIVTWHGGEPTLFSNQLIEASHRINAIASSYGIEPRYHLVSNGTTLSDKVLSNIAESGVSRIQLSIDWPASKSERAVSMLTAEETVHLIFRNAQKVPERIDLVFRINVLEPILEQFDDLLDSLIETVSRPFGVYTHHIVEEGDIDRSKETAQFRQFQLSFKRMLRERGIPQPFFPDELISGDCMARKKGGLVFSPLVKKGKCFAEVASGEAKIDDSGSPNERAAEYMGWEGFRDSECQSCRFLPICHGGCAKKAVENKADLSERCTPWKFMLEQELTDYLLSQSKNRNV